MRIPSSSTLRRSGIVSICFVSMMALASPAPKAPWVLFDKNDPTKVIGRSDNPIFTVAQEWEKVGQVPNVVFVEGAVKVGNRWLFYYGGADKYVGVAVARELPHVKPPNPKHDGAPENLDRAQAQIKEP